MKEKLDNYEAMHDNYYTWDEAKYYDIAKLGNINTMSERHLEPGAAVQFWEWLAGSGRMSATAQ